MAPQMRRKPAFPASQARSMQESALRMHGFSARRFTVTAAVPAINSHRPSSLSLTRLTHRETPSSVFLPNPLSSALLVPSFSVYETGLRFASINRPPPPPVCSLFRFAFLCRHERGLGFQIGFVVATRKEGMCLTVFSGMFRYLSLDIACKNCQF